MYLSQIMRSAKGLAALPLTYGNWLGHSAVVATCNARIVDETNRTMHVHFTENPERTAMLQSAEQVVGKWADEAWQLRKDALVYPWSPSLTKSLGKSPGGINDSQYDLVHNIIEMNLGYSYETIESLLQHFVGVDLEFIPEDIERFLHETRTPGLKAAGWGRTTASAVSLATNAHILYAADGAVQVSPTGLQYVASESWLRQAPRVPATQMGDCDDAAIWAKAFTRAVEKAPPSVTASHPYIRAAQNTIFPYYTVGVTVLGATTAEATSVAASDQNPAQLAGHAAVLMMPTVGLLAALDDSASARVGGGVVVAPALRTAVAEARFAACFPPSALASLPEEERTKCASWATAKAAADTLSPIPLAIEGTAPLSPLLYVTGKVAEKAAATAAADEVALSRAAPNVGRSMKVMYVGGSDPQNPHRFYHDFVELNLGRSHPLWTSEALRENGAAMTQIVLGKQANRVNNTISVAGATPRELVTRQYSAVPLISTDTKLATLIDYASEQADLNVMPPRPPAATLDEFQSAQLGKSFEALAALDDVLKNGNDASPGHTVAYLLAYSTLINNPKGVEHFCRRLKSVATFGMVDALDIAGLAKDVHGAEAGKMVVVNARIPI